LDRVFPVDRGVGAEKAHFHIATAVSMPPPDTWENSFPEIYDAF